MMNYFAYGSNMDSFQMSKRCPHCRQIGKAHLRGFRWIISKRGYANIVNSNEDDVEGILFTISDSDESSLDRYEGVSHGCYEKAILKITYDGAEIDALVYIDPISEEGKPKYEYIDRINDALSDANLSQEYVAKYVRKFIPEKHG